MQADRSRFRSVRRADNRHRHVARHASKIARHRTMTNSHFTDEEHSLQGKTGKTHAVC